MSNFKIGTKLMAAFLVVSLIAGIVGTIGYVGIRDIGEIRVQSLKELGVIELNAMEVWIGERGLTNPYMMEPKIRQAQYAYIEEAWAAIDESREKYERLLQTDQERSSWQQFLHKFQIWKNSVLRLVEMSKQKDSLIASGVDTKEDRLSAIDDNVFQLSLENRSLKLDNDTLLNQIVETNHETAASTTRDAKLSMITTASVSVLAALLIGILISRSITRPLQEMTAAAEGLAIGNIHQKIVLNQRDELGILASAFRRTIDAQKHKAEIAADISLGKTDVNVQIFSDDDILGKAMAQMVNSQQDRAALAEQIAKGNVGVNVKILSKHDTLGNALAKMVLMQKERALLAEELALGNTDIEVEILSEADVLGKSMAAMIQVQKERAEIAEEIARGNASVEVDVLSEKDFLGKAMSAMVKTQKERASIALDIARGYIDVEVNVLSVKDVLGSAMADMVAAQKDRAKIAEEIAHGNLSMNVEVLSDRDVLGNAMRKMKDNILLLATDAGQLVDAAVGGRLSQRSDVSRHFGEFRKIVEGVNMTLDAVIRPINDAAEVLADLAAYDLTARVTGVYQGDHAKISSSINEMATVLHNTMDQMAQAATQVSSASTQIASSSRHVAEGASEQAGALEETSSALEQMASMTNQNADNTERAKRLSETTRVAANKGATAMHHMLGSMDQIKRSAEGTAAIIKDINDIAFQTNLLALNAAVEAARAGDAGRGFAVVAEEVRNLAGRAKDAAKNTEALINESVRLAEDGQKISSSVNENLGEIVQSVSKVAEIVTSIATASQEQARGIAQVNRAVVEMDKVVQQSASNAEESSSAAEELAGQASQVAAMVGRFHLLSA